MTTAAFIATPLTIKRIVWWIFGLLLLYFGFQLIRYHYLMVTFPYPLEYREGAVPYTTNLLLQGENPYALENMPTAINVYGINYHFVVYPFARLWGATFLVHRAVSAVFLLFACILFYVTLRRQQVEPLYGLSAVLVLYASLLYRYTALARPDALGFFLFMLSISVAYLDQYSTRSLLISSVAGIAAFYTKAYFVLPIPYLIIYLFLFVSKKKAVVYSFVSCLLLLITASITNAIFETYFVNTFFNHINVAANDIYQLRLQLGLFLIYNSGFVLLFIVFVCLAIFDIRRAQYRWDQGLLSNIKNRHAPIDLLDPNKPFVDVAFPFWLFCLIFSLIIFYFKMGRHNGNHMTYAYHLITPFFLFVVYPMLGWRLRNLPSAQMIQSNGYVFVIPCILVSLHLLCSSATSLKDTLDNYLRAWQRVETITLSYSRIMNSPVIASLLMEQNKVVYDAGQTEYFRYSHYSSAWLSEVLISNAAVSKQWKQYEDTIRETVIQQGFDAIIITPWDHAAYLDGLQEGYQLIGTVEVCMFHTDQCAPLEIWESTRIDEQD